MKTVGTYQAKSSLTSILRDVAAGETYMITNHGRSVAELRPPKHDKLTFREALDFLKSIPRPEVTEDELSDILYDGDFVASKSKQHQKTFSRDEAIDRLMTFSAGRTLGDVSIKELKEYGRA